MSKRFGRKQLLLGHGNWPTRLERSIIIIPYMYVYVWGSAASATIVLCIVLGSLQHSSPSIAETTSQTFANGFRRITRQRPLLTPMQ